MFTLEDTKDGQKPGSVTDKPKVVRKTTAETDHLIAGLGSYLSSQEKRDGYISARLDTLVLSDRNGRIGQKELLQALPKLVEVIQGYLTGVAEKEVPKFEELRKAGECPSLSISASRLYDNCAELANTFLANGGFADTPPKVYPAVDGLHQMKTGHRRVIAYHLVQAITGLTYIDVILDKGSDTQTNILTQDISRLTENASRVDNTLAELISSMKLVFDKTLEETGKEPNNAKFSRETGIERTKVGRIFDMIKQGAAEDERLLAKLHENKIEDVTSLQLLFLNPKDKWDSLIDELIVLGPSKFRENYRVSEPNRNSGSEDAESANEAGSLSKDKDPKKIKTKSFRMNDTHIKSVGLLLSHLEKSKLEWLEGIEPDLSPIEKLFAILEKMSTAREE